MSAFILKLIAVFSMICDHFSYLIFGNFSFLNLLGRLAFPIFAFQITEGYVHTSNLKKYFLRLFIFALISQIPFMLFYSIISEASSLHLNIFFTLFLGLLSIFIYDKLDNLEYPNSSLHLLSNLIGTAFVIILSILASIIKCDYGYFGILSIFMFYIFRKHKLLMNFSFILLVFFYYAQNLFITKSYIALLLVVFTVFPLVFINLYNHKKGKDTKYFLYLFYPVHLLIIYAIYYITNYINL